MIIMDRTRRLRMNATLRDMVRENHVRVDELIYPVFVTEENDVIQEVPSMPGICQYSLDHVLEEIGRAVEVGIKGILLFGIPVHKDEVGSEAYDEEGVVCRAIRLIKDAYPELVIMADVCLCEYTSHGHCGLVKDGVILNDETLPLLAKASVAYAKAGADIIAPSDMMDKRVEAIRNALDRQDWLIFLYVHTVPNLHQDITDRSGMPHIQHRDLVTERHIRWTRLMEKKR